MLQQLRIDLHDLGYRPSVAATVLEAHNVLENERVAAVLLDLVLDEHEDSGFELLTWIRQHHPGLPVIVLSAAQVNSASIRRAYELGASSYFVKGNVPMAHIYSDLAARLVERGTGRPGTYRFGRLEFDPTRRSAKLGERDVRLTQQQAAVILFLAQGSKPATARDGRSTNGAAPTAPTGDGFRRTRQYSPVVLKLAAEHNIDLALVRGTGIEGRVTRQDVLAYIENPMMHMVPPGEGEGVVGVQQKQRDGEENNHMPERGTLRQTGCRPQAVAASPFSGGAAAAGSSSFQFCVSDYETDARHCGATATVSSGPATP